MAAAESRAVVLSVARQIVDGEVSPYRGAASIWASLAEQPGGYPPELAVFVGLASEWQDSPDDRNALDDDIRDEARRLIEETTE